jgi:hypothetical protein
MIESTKSVIEHTLEKICGEWYIWEGNPRTLDTRTAVAGPIHTRWRAFEKAMELSAEGRAAASGVSARIENDRVIREAARGH